MEKVSVLGGSGFIGTNFCQILKTQGISFEIIDLKRSETYPDQSKIADIRDIEQLRDAITGDIVVNLAAVHRDDVRDISEYYSTNVNGCEIVSRICEEKGIQKIVFTSSVAVYGFAVSGTGEDGAIDPFNDYGKSKFLGEEKLRSWHAVAPKERSLIIVRPTVVFGEGNRGNVYNLLRQIATGKFVMIGNGRNKKSLAYVKNVCAFLFHCVQSNQKYSVVNYVDTPDMDMNTLVATVNKQIFQKQGVGLRLPYFAGIIAGKCADVVSMVTRKNLPVSSIRIKKFCSNTCFSSAKEKFDEFDAPHQLLEALHRTIDAEFVSPDPTRPIFYTE